MRAKGDTQCPYYRQKNFRGLHYLTRISDECVGCPEHWVGVAVEEFIRFRVEVSRALDEHIGGLFYGDGARGLFGVKGENLSDKAFGGLAFDWPVGEEEGAGSGVKKTTPKARGRFVA